MRRAIRVERLRPFWRAHKWFGAGRSLGDSQTWSECLGLQVRYSFGKAGALFLEASYEHFDTTDDRHEYRPPGLTSQVGVRVPLSPGSRLRQPTVFWRPGLGTKHLIQSRRTNPTFGTDDGRGYRPASSIRVPAHARRGRGA